MCSAGQQICNTVNVFKGLHKMQAAGHWGSGAAFCHVRILIEQALVHQLELWHELLPPNSSLCIFNLMLVLLRELSQFAVRE